MGTGIYVGADGVARKVKSMYVGVENLARKIKSAYIGVNGVARKWYTSELKLAPLSVAREDLAATTVGNYALFGGGNDPYIVGTVDAYDGDLNIISSTTE